MYSILGLDIGEQRTGVAIANSIVGIASPLVTLHAPDTLVPDIAQIVNDKEVKVVVVGLPRNLKGQATSQTAYVEKIATELENTIGLPIHFIDEALTSSKAEDELKNRGKAYQKEDIDMLAATYILEDFLVEHPEVMNV